MEKEKDSNMVTAIILPTLISMNRKQRPLVSFAVPMGELISGVRYTKHLCPSNQYNYNENENHIVTDRDVALKRESFPCSCETAAFIWVMLVLPTSAESFAHLSKNLKIWFEKICYVIRMKLFKIDSSQIFLMEKFMRNCICNKSTKVKNWGWRQQSIYFFYPGCLSLKYATDANAAKTLGYIHSAPLLASHLPWQTLSLCEPARL